MNLDAAVAFARSSLGYSEDDVAGAYELSDELDTLQITLDDGSRVSFRAHLAAMQAANDMFPCLFASTEE